LDDEALPELAIENVIEDFVYTFRQQIGCIEQAESFSELVEDGEEFGMLKVPFVHEALCTSRLLTLEHLRGTTLSDAFLLTKEDEGVEAMFFARARLDREDLARRLCGLWLRQVFLGRFFPVDPSAANITVLPNRQLAFTSGPFERLPSGPKANVSDYLTAVASDNLDRAYDCFFVELMKATPGGKQDDLRNRFRQIVPLRDSGWTAGGDGNSLAEYLFGHWRLATQRGHLPPPYLSSFYRGLFLIASVASRLSPERDALSEGLQDLRFFTGLEKFRDLVDPRYLGDQMEKYGAMMMQLPERIDEVMSIAAGGNTQLRIQLSESAARRRTKNSVVKGIVLLLVLMGFALLSRRLAPSFPEVWVNAVNAVVFVALGGMLLRTASSA
jgi:ubiquinone biosynthesis protein